MTREQYESLPLAELKEIAKARELKKTSGMKKGDLIDLMLEKDEEMRIQKEREAAGKKERTEYREKSERSERAERSERSEKTERNERSERAERAEYSEHHVKTERADRQERRERAERAERQPLPAQDASNLDSGQVVTGILEVLGDGYGFIRSDNYLPGENDIYINPAMIRRYNLKTGDILCGNVKVKAQTEKFAALLYLKSINGCRPEEAAKRRNFEDLTPIFPNERIHLERPGGSTAMRIVDLISPIGKGQRGMIVSPPKAGKTTLLKDVAKSVTRNHPEMQLLILLIDERPRRLQISRKPSRDRMWK